MPPSNLNSKVFDFSFLLSVKLILNPLFKYASSFNRFSSILRLKLVSVNISLEGLKVIVVPFKSELLISFKGALVAPFSNSTKYFLPFLEMSTFKLCESALTTETPTPCNPPETL